MLILKQMMMMQNLMRLEKFLTMDLLKMIDRIMGICMVIMSLEKETIIVIITIIMVILINMVKIMVDIKTIDISQEIITIIMDIVIQATITQVIIRIIAILAIIIQATIRAIAIIITEQLVHIIQTMVTTIQIDIPKKKEHIIQMILLEKIIERNMIMVMECQIQTDM